MRMSRKNRGKSALFLMEFIVVILFFSLSMAVCLNGFVKANQLSEDSKLLNGAMILAQSKAEEIKATASLIRENDKHYQDGIYYVQVMTQVQDEILVANIGVFDGENRENEICRLEVIKYLPEEVLYDQ